MIGYASRGTLMFCKIRKRIKVSLYGVGIMITHILVPIDDKHEEGYYWDVRVRFLAWYIHHPVG